MTTFDLVFVVCSVVSSQCHEVRQRKAAQWYPTPFECAHMGQVEAQKWLADHPGYKLNKYTCSRPQERV